jgi:excisionase family DNA binding protein
MTSINTDVDAQRPQWLTVRDVEGVTSLSRAYLYKCIATGELESFTVGRARRISARSLADFMSRIEAGTVEAEEAG